MGSVYVPRRCLVLGVCCLLWLLWPAPAVAHSDLVSSYPGDEVRLSSPPDQVVLEFAEPVLIQEESLVVRGPDGRQRPRDVLSSGSGQLLVAVLRPDGPAGRWSIDYDVVAVDGHTISGSYHFSVGTDASSGGGEERWDRYQGALAGLLVALGYGVSAAARAVRTGDGPAPAQRPQCPSHESDASRRPRPGRRAPGRSRGVVLVVCAVLVVSTVLAAFTTSPAQSPGAAFLASVLSVLRAVGTLGACGTVGSLALAMLVRRGSPADGTAPNLAHTASAWAAVWAVAAACSAVLLLAQGGTDSVATVVHGAGTPDENVVGVVVQPARAWILTAWAAGAVAVLARGRTGPGLVIASSCLSVAALAPSVLAGHSGHADARIVGVVSMLVHVFAVTVWVGGLLVLTLHARWAQEALGVLRRFSVLALLCFLAVGASGVTNVLSRMTVAELAAGRGYAVLLLAKLSLFVILGGVGLTHRFRTLGRLEAGRPSAFWVLVAGELVLMAAAIGMAAVLSRTGT